MRNEHEITHEIAAGRIGDALRKYVGRGQRYSFQTLSEHTGISKRSLESYVYESNAPRADVLLTLFAFLGPAFTSEVLSVCGQTAKAESDDTPEYVRVMADAGGLVSEIATALEDGKVDHREAASIQPRAKQLIERLQPMARVSTVPFRGNVA